MEVSPWRRAQVFAKWGMASRKGIEHPTLPESDPPASAICMVDSFRPAKIDLDVDPSWLKTASTDDALPPKMLDRLTLAPRLQNAAATLKTESAFWAVCHAQRAVGICESKPVAYPYLAGMVHPSRFELVGDRRMDR